MAPLATLQQLAERTGEQYDPADIRARRALEDASALVRLYTGQVFDLLEDEDITVNGSGTRALLLPQAPVTEVSEVLLLGDDETIEALEAVDYRLLEAEGILVRLTTNGSTWGATWPIGYRNVALRYTHGYSTPPPAIVAATCQIAGRLRIVGAGLVSGASGTVTQETIGSYSVSFGDSTTATQDAATGLTADERALLDPYRMVSLA